MEQYWMDEQDLWLIELVKPLPDFPNLIKKQIYITCKAQTGLGQSQKTHMLYLGPSRPSFEKQSNIEW
jgi:hypothetical protein